MLIKRYLKIYLWKIDWFDGLEVKGLFRTNGRDKLAKSLIQAVLRGESLDAWSYQNGLQIEDICQAIKQYLHIVQLIPFSFYAQIEALQSVGDREEVVRTIQQLLSQLEVHHRETLKRFVIFLGRIIEHSAENCMTGTDFLRKKRVMVDFWSSSIQLAYLHSLSRLSSLPRRRPLGVWKANQVYWLLTSRRSGPFPLTSFHAVYWTNQQAEEKLIWHKTNRITLAHDDFVGGFTHHLGFGHLGRFLCHHLYRRLLFLFLLLIRVQVLLTCLFMIFSSQSRDHTFSSNIKRSLLNER